MRSVHPSAGAGRLRPAPLAVLILVALATLLGCTSSDAGGSEPVATTDVQLPRSYRFDPVAITVTVGATVTWTNGDNFTHNVAFEGSQPMKLSPGATATRTFDTAGTFPYQCTLHPQDMQGTVEVTPS
ncbi:MAG TPA: plastocyanin/azurin family copper-binding protein [Candidatus Limnocylindrales bacterium]|nr:plastocyanin/azurin family copper-binding protein [Candidatus Limnocylindrales bacterium]